MSKIVGALLLALTRFVVFHHRPFDEKQGFEPRTPFFNG
jgi:hypothetical protein